MVPPLEDQGLAISGTAGEHSPICCSTPTIEVDLRTSDSTLVNEHSTPPLEPELSAIDISSLIEMPSLECSISSCDSECVLYTPGGNQNSVESVAPVEPAVIISHADNDIEVLIGMMERLKVSSDAWLPQKSTGRKTPKETGRLEAPSSVYGPILAGLD
ncbi:hypothetical protein CTheo_3807 [Ceratobasidium theobromae]|uniref:Uncharacterized protein n=1 Tax=Ceratobasidium theobromae TaxID=1582974 RepID=A0A5N5QM33_9AGAM|nr:hypothetical protein CTheo_3807 [Ceratobasidium theobromae]